MFNGSISTKQFLANYWQQQPLLIKNAFPGFTDPLSPEELAGLACEEDAEARLVFTRKKSWQLQSGPFAEADFTSLPARNWTLLVQAVDQWVPQVRDLLESVAFIPNWRVDDVMVSYATQGGGVGPHFDYYDVFLLQGQGSRIWKTGQHCTSHDVMRSSSGLKLLNEFHCENEWLLESGDVLYVPPGIAHWGVSQDDSLCYSLGFRAPSVSEMLLGFSDELSDQLSPDLRYTDPRNLSATPQAGEIDPAALQQARRLVTKAMSDPAAFARWFGCHMTQVKYPELIQAPRTSPDLSQAHCQLAPHPASRFAWQQHNKQLLVFVDGNCLEYASSSTLLKLVQQLCCANSVIRPAPYLRHSPSRQLLEILLAQGSVIDAGMA